MALECQLASLVRALVEERLAWKPAAHLSCYRALEFEAERSRRSSRRQISCCLRLSRLNLAGAVMIRRGTSYAFALILCFCANLHSRKREELELASYCFLLLLLPSHTGEMLQR